MLNIFVVRHGQTDANIKNLFNGLNDFDLTKEGISQAKNLQKELLGRETFDKIFCSPLKRAVHTANILNVQNLPILKSELIKERDFGSYTLKPTTLVNDMSVLYKKGENPILAIESYDSVCNRVGKFIDFLKSQNKSGNFLVVTHGDIQHAFNDYFNKPYNHYPENCEVFKFSL